MSRYFSVLSLILVSAALLSYSPPAFSAKEVEPNTLPEQANPIRVGEPVTGLFEDSFDHFRISLPAAGKVTVTLSGCPAGGNVQLGVKDFGYTGWEESNGRTSVSLTFDATSTNGLIWVKPTFLGSTCGKDWCIARFTPNAPYRVTKRSPNLPGSYEGSAIEPEVYYQLTVVQAGAAPGGTQPPVGTTTPAEGRKPGLPQQPQTQPVATGPVATQPAGASGTMKVFKDNHLGFSFELPAAMSWDLLPDKSGYMISGPAGTDLNEVVIVVQAISKSANRGSSVKKQLKEARDQVARQPGAKILTDEIDSKKVAGGKAPYFMATYPARDSRQQQTQFRHMQTVVENGPNYYWISYAAPGDIFKENKEIFTHMLKTLRF